MSDSVSVLGLDFDTSGLDKGVSSIDRIASAMDMLAAKASQVGGTVSDALAQAGTQGSTSGITATVPAAQAATDQLNAMAAASDQVGASLQAIGAANPFAAINDNAATSAAEVNTLKDAIDRAGSALEEATSQSLVNVGSNAETAAAQLNVMTDAANKVGASLEEIDNGAIGKIGGDSEVASQRLGLIASAAQSVKNAFASMASAANAAMSFIKGEADDLALRLGMVKKEASAAGATLEEVGSSAGKSTQGIHSSSTAFREALVLIHEGASGNYKRMFGSGLIELQAIAGVQTAAAVIGGLAAVAATAGAAFLILNQNMKDAFPQDSNLSKSLKLTSDQIKQLKEDGVSLGVNFGDRVKATFETLGEDIANAMKNVTGAAGNAFDNIAQAIGKATPGILATVYALSAGVVKFFTDMGSAIGGVIYNALVPAFNAVLPAFNAFINAIRGPLNAVIDAFNIGQTAKVPEIPKVDFKPLQQNSHVAFNQIGADISATYKSAYDQAYSYAEGFSSRAEDRARKDRIKLIQEDLGDPKKGREDPNIAGFQAQLIDYQTQSTKLEALRAANVGNADYETTAIGQLAEAYDKTKKAFADYVEAKASKNALAARQAKDAADQALKDYKDQQAEAENLAKQSFQSQGKAAAASATATDGAFAGAVVAEQYKLVEQRVELKREGANLDDAENAKLLQRNDILNRAFKIVTDTQSAQRDALNQSIDGTAKEQAAQQKALNSNDYEAYQLATAKYQLEQKYALLKGDELDKAARELVAQQKLTEEQKTQAAQLKSVSLDTSVNSAASSLNAASNKFWANFVVDGGAAFQTLGQDLTNIFRSTVADGLKAGFQPVLSWLQDGLKSAVSSVFTGVRDSFTGLLKQAGILGSDGKFATTGLGSIIGIGAQAATSGFVDQQIGQGLSSLAGGAKSPEQQTNSMIGAATTAILGAIAFGFGPIGFALDAILGGFIGGLLGPSSTNAGAGQGLLYSGEANGAIQGNKRTNETTQLLQAVTGAIAQGYNSIAQLGGTRTTYVTGVTVGQRDPSAISLSNGQGLSATTGDAAAAANVALLAVLKDTTFAVQGLNQIKDAMIAAGSSFDDTSKILSSVKTVLDSVQPPASTFSKALTDLEAQFDPLIKSANDASAAFLRQAEAEAKAQLASAFNTDISNQLLKAQSSVASQYKDMLTTQSQRIQDATKLGGDLNQVLALNQQETNNFIASLFPYAKQTSTITDNIQALTTAFKALSDQAAKAGQSTDQITQAYQNAFKSLQEQFNQSTADSLLQAANPTLASLESLLKTQAQRLADAKALNVDLTATQRLNAIETSNFFAGLSATQKAQLGDYLGLIEDYTGKIGVVGTQLQDALTPIVSNMTSIINALNASASTLRNLALTISQTKDAIAQKYGAAAPTDALDTLRANFQTQAGLAKNGDQTALQGLSQLANTFIDASHALYGSTSKFVSDYDLVQSLLGQASQGATDAATQAENQAQALQTQINLLTDIKNILGDSNPQIAALQKDYETLLASSSQVSATIASILLQPNHGLTGVTTDVSTYQIGSQSITDLLAQYLALQAKQSGQSLNADQLAQLSLLTAGSAANAKADSQATAVANATVPANLTTGNETIKQVSTVTPTTDTTASDTLSATLAGYFQLLQQQIRTDDATQLTVLQNLLTEFRKLTLYTQQSTAKA